MLPEVDQLRGVEQNPYHHRDVFEHTTEALTYVVGVVAQLGGRQFLTTPEEAGLPGVGPLVPVSWAVLQHDIGKPLVRVVDDRGRVIFWHHDEAGRRMCAEIGRRLKLSNRFVEYVGTLVRQHLRLGFLTHEQPLTRRALARYRRDVHPWVFESVVVSLCDRLATRGEKTSLSSVARHYRLARTVWTEVSKAPTPRVLSGDDVPMSLRNAALLIGPRAVLFVYGEEGQAVEKAVTPVYYEAALPTKEIWVVPGAGHTGGIEAEPDLYEQVVIGFFDRILLPKR